MKASRAVALAMIIGLGGASLGGAQSFSSGSNGSFGPINVTSGVVTLDLPADGIFHATTVAVAQGASLKFNRNSLNTPVFLLATGDINIAGIVDVSGEAGTPGTVGRGGPGGFDGGSPGFDTISPGAGHGPGAGLGGDGSGTNSGAGGGAYGGTPAFAIPPIGKVYGSPLLVPLVGGSGSGGVTGSPGRGGDGGGGAVLLSSNTSVSITGTILAHGGYDRIDFAGGSGGAIRIVAPAVLGSGTLNVQGDSVYLSSYGGPGRIRVDVIDRSGLNLRYEPPASLSVGAFLLVFPSPIPRLDIIEAAGQQIPEGTSGPVLVTLPFGSSQDRTVTVQARDFTGTVLVDVVLTPASGPRQVVQTTINMTTNPSQATVNVTLPVNVVTRINAWTR